ncbi:MAG: aromatic ring-hydroxylating dioxygenase subunit alpha [Halieaceae bacterium]
MRRDIATSLNRRLLINVENNTTDTVDGEMRALAEAYLSPERHLQERSALFYETPQPVAFSGEVAEPGSYLALDVLDVPVLLTRSESGNLHAFINACSHRGARVAEDCGQSRNLVCVFHGWTYSHSGELLGRPQDDCFDSDKQSLDLQRLPVSEKHGIVVIGLRPAVPQVAVDTALEGIGDELAGLRLERYAPVGRKRYTVAANWKLVTDLSLESYHFATLHRDSVAEILTHHAVFDTMGRHTRWAFPLKSIKRLQDIDEADWPEAIEGSCTYTLFPGVMIIVNASGAQMIRAEPGANSAISRVCYVGVRTEDTEPDAALQAYNFGGDVFENEDLPVARQCQQGMEAGGRDLVFGRNEPLLQYWHKLWASICAS